MSLIMDPESLLNLKSTFDHQAEAAEQLRATIQSSVDSTVWESPAANEFRDIWATEFTPMLNNLREALIKAGMGVQNSHDKVVEANSRI